MAELAAFGASAAACAARAPRGGAFADAVRGEAALAAAAELAAGGARAVAAVAAWLVAAATADSEARAPPPPGPGLVHRDAVAALAALLTQAAAGDDENDDDDDAPTFCALFDALQADAEDAGLLDPASPALDDWLPAATVHAFAAGAVEGVAGVLGRVCG